MPGSNASPMTPTTRQALEALAILAIAYGLSRPLGFTAAGIDLLAVAAMAIGARLGFWAGAGAGLVATAIRLAELGHHPGDYLSLTIDRHGLAGALCYLLGGALVGLLGDFHRLTITRQHEELQALQGRYDQLAGRHQVIVTAKEALDQRIIGQVQTVSSMYDAARELEVLDAAAILPATARLAARFLGAEALAVYTLEGFRLRLAAHWGDRSDRPNLLAIDDGPLGTVVRTGQAAQVRNKEEYARSRVLMAAPLRHPDGMVRGVIALEQLPFSAMTPTTAHLLDLIADWAGRALANSESFAVARSREPIHPLTGLPRAGALLQRLQEEWALATRYRLPLSAVLVRRSPLSELPAERRDAAALSLAQDLKRMVREVDRLGHFHSSDTFLVLLPLTDLAGAEALARRIRFQLPDVNVAISGNQTDAKTPEAMLQMLQILSDELEVG